MALRLSRREEPVPLRAVATDRSDGGLVIEADLPWLSVGAVFHADLADDAKQTGRVHSFDIDVTPAARHACESSPMCRRLARRRRSCVHPLDGSGEGSSASGGGSSWERSLSRRPWWASFSGSDRREPVQILTPLPSRRLRIPSGLHLPDRQRWSCMTTGVRRDQFSGGPIDGRQGVQRRMREVRGDSFAGWRLGRRRGGRPRRQRPTGHAVQVNGQHVVTGRSDAEVTLAPEEVLRLVRELVQQLSNDHRRAVADFVASAR